jgi:hypothetical protein
MRRTWLRGRENVHKRYLVHVAGHNLGILMRLDGSKNRWHLGLIADSVSLGARGIGDGRATWIF